MVGFLPPSLLESALIFPDMSSVRIVMRAPSPKQLGVCSLGLCIAGPTTMLSVSAITAAADAFLRVLRNPKSLKNPDRTLIEL